MKYSLMGVLLAVVPAAGCIPFGPLEVCNNFDEFEAEAGLEDETSFSGGITAVDVLTAVSVAPTSLRTFQPDECPSEPIPFALELQQESARVTHRDQVVDEGADCDSDEALALESDHSQVFVETSARLTLGAADYTIEIFAASSPTPDAESFSGDALDDDQTLRDALAAALDVEPSSLSEVRLSRFETPDRTSTFLAARLGPDDLFCSWRVE